MNRKEIKRDIALFQARLERNAGALGVDNLKQIEHSPVVQNHLIVLVGGALAGGFAAGELSKRLRLPLKLLLPYLFKI